MFRSLFLLAILSTAVASADPLGTGFTYQGELRDGGTPATGSYDLQFELFDAEAIGAIVAGPLVIENVPVSDGVFTVELDFGATPFAGDQLWLEIGVRDGASPGGFTGLLPRQTLTATPYALHAEMVAADAISGVEIANNSITSADIGANAVGSSELASNSVGAAEIASNAVGTAEIQNGSVTAADIADFQRTLLFPASSLGRFPTATAASDGVPFPAAGGVSANLVIQRPADWDGSSAIVVELFTRGSVVAGTGTARFFMRPRDYNDGDTFLDVGGISSNTRTFSTTGQYREFTINLSAASLPKDWWHLVIQRSTIGVSYPNDVTLVSVAVSYTAVR